MKLLISRARREPWNAVCATRRELRVFRLQATAEDRCGRDWWLFGERRARKWSRTWRRISRARAEEESQSESFMYVDLSLNRTRISRVISSRVHPLSCLSHPSRRRHSPCRCNKYSPTCSLPGYCTWDWNWPRCRCDPLDYSPPGDCILITRHQARVKTIVQGLRSRALRDGWRSRVRK